MSINNGFAWNHGYYSPNIDVTWSSLVGPGVAARGLDGPQPAAGNQPHDPNSTHTVPQASTVGTWVEETDLRPTLLHLTGLQDDYPTDGRVISQALSAPNGSLQQTSEVAAAYQQLNSSVGAFATDTLIADSAALASGSSADDSAYACEQSALSDLAARRDQLVTAMKATLADATAGRHISHGETTSELARARGILAAAEPPGSAGWLLTRRPSADHSRPGPTTSRCARRARVRRTRRTRALGSGGRSG